MKLNPLVCGFWDGVSIWLQWDSIGDRYSVRVRYRRNAESEWGNWVEVVPKQGKKKPWGVIPTWKEGWQVQAEVSLDRPGLDPEWELAQEVVFEKSKATFEFSSSKYPQRFEAGTLFHAIIDHAACAYEISGEVDLDVGETKTLEMFSQGLSGYNQLDHENHFDIRPAYGVRVRNLSPSVNDVRPTGKDFVIIQADKPKTFSMAFGVKLKN